MDVALPYQVDPFGRTAAAEGADHTRDLLEQVLFTRPGERVMRPSFGSGIAQLVFEPNSEELATAVEFLVQANLQQWLADVLTVGTIDVTSTDSTIEVRVEYQERRTGARRVEQFSRPT